MRLENQPRVRMQADRYAAAVAKLEKDSEEKEAASRKILKQEPWGSAKYQEAFKEFNRLRDACTKRMEQLAAEQAAVAVVPVEYSLSLMQLLIALAILPLAWLIARVVPWLRKPAPPAQRGRIPPRLLTVVAAVSSLLFIAVSILWGRGRFIEDRLVYNTRSPATLTVRSYSIWSLDGDIHLVRTERIYAQRGAFDFENPTSVANGLANSSWVPTRPGLGYASIKVVHTPQSLSTLLGIRYTRAPNSRHLFTP